MDREIEFHFRTPEDSLGYLLWQTSMQWQKNMNRALKELKLTHTQFVILAALGWLLKEGEEVTQKEIAAHSNTDRMMVSKILRNLQKNELIERREHSTDTRAKCVSLTVAGKKKLQRALKIVQDTDNAFFASIEEEQTVKKELQKLIQ